MIEKRKKLSNANPSYAEEDNLQAGDDVEEYEVKKSTFRHQWGYFAIGALVLILMYVQYQSSIISPPTQVQNPVKLSPELQINKSHVAKPVKAPEDSYDVKTGLWGKGKGKGKRATQDTPHAENPATATAPDAHLAAGQSRSNQEQQNLRKGAAVAHEVGTTEAELQTRVDAQIAKLRHMKFKEHIVMERSEDAKKEIAILQDELRTLIRMQYGPGPYTVEMRVLFPESMAKEGFEQEQSIFIDLAPIYLVPYSVYNFLQIIKNYKGGAFHRNAGHVLQAQVNTGGMQGLAFQEYHPDFPHKQYTMGYAGRPSGPAFYISTVNNVANHGPASQGSATEADACFGKIQQQSLEIVKRMEKQPGAAKPQGFIPDAANHIKILSMTVLNHK